MRFITMGQEIALENMMNLHFPRCKYLVNFMINKEVYESTIENSTHNYGTIIKLRIICYKKSKWLKLKKICDYASYER
jgi:hypothetical protein